MMAAVANTMRGAPGAETGGDGMRAPREGSTGHSRLPTLTDLRDALDIDQRAARQVADRDRRSGRVGRHNVTHVDLVDGGRVGDVGKEDPRLKRLRKARPG